MCEELHGSLEFLSCSGEENNDKADDGGHIWIHEGFWEYWAGRRYVRVIYGMIWEEDRYAGIFKARYLAISLL